MVLGAGSTSILESNNSAVRLDEHRRNLTKVRAELENIAQFGGTRYKYKYKFTVQVFSTSVQYKYKCMFRVLWALEAPVDWERLNGTRRGRGLTNEALGRYNSEANKVSGPCYVIFWSLIDDKRLETPYRLFLSFFFM